ncbi:MAG: inositol monophosphatase family protein [Myxococcota bacterium]|nr:inositol monophosphatase family protein [Myxococcota bacterium]
MTEARRREAREALAIAERLAREAGEIQRKRYETSFQVETKGTSTNLVTEVDKQCEALIVEAIERERPGEGILAEEGGGHDDRSAEWCWVVDPLDGTTNFAHGYPRFCVSIGVERDGEREAGAIYDPLLDEMFLASRGDGATLNGKPLRVSNEATLVNALAATGFAYDIHQSEDDNLANFARMIKATRAVRRDGSAALDLCYVAAGRFDAFWEFKLHPWDVSAGVVIVEEAGGRCTDVVGDPVPRSGAEIIASNTALHDSILELLERHGQHN